MKRNCFLVNNIRARARVVFVFSRGGAAIGFPRVLSPRLRRRSNIKEESCQTNAIFSLTGSNSFVHHGKEAEPSVTIINRVHIISLSNVLFARHHLKWSRLDYISKELSLAFT